MSRIYGEAAIEAFQLLEKDKSLTPIEAWDKAVSKKTNSKHSQIKTCPRTTFLAVCDLGKHNLKIPNTVVKQTKNYEYTIIMLEYINEKKGDIESKKELWEAVQKKINKELKNNGQSGVVFSLLKKDYLNWK